jgi:Leucine-rich repeat (LRR) protein
MQRLGWLAIIACGSCAHPRPPAPIAPVAIAPSAPIPRPPAVSPWDAVPVRVMTWTPRGVQQLGTLPGELPQPLPALWYVEPIGALDEPGFRRLVGAVRSEHVPGLSLRGQPVAPWLAQLQELPELRALLLDHTDVDGAALAAMQLSLRRLYLAQTAIDDAAIAALAARYPALETLDIEDTAVGDPGARAIAKLTGLRAVNLAATQITDEGGAALGQLTQLEIADLGSTKVGARTVAALRGLPLHELFLDRTRVRGELATLAPLAPQLVRFDVAGTAHHPTDAELGWLAGAAQLVELSVSGARLHDPLALTLVHLPHVREVRMADTEITSATIHALAARTDLDEIDLAGTPVDDASAQALIDAPAMRIARFDATPISDAAFAGPAGPNLVELYASRTQITDLGLAILEGAPHLVALGLGHTRIGDAGLARIAKLAELHTLVLSQIDASPEAFGALASLHELERLYLDQTHAGDLAVTLLAPAHATLRVLHLAGSDVSETGLAALQAFTQLTELTIGDSRMHAGIADLSAWPRLRTLSLVGLDLTDKALPQIAAQPSLVMLDLSATEIRDPSPLAALPRLRTLGVAQTRLSPAGVAATRRLAARGVEIVR